MTKSISAFFWLSGEFVLFTLLVSCSQNVRTTGLVSLNLPPKPQPEVYVCYQTSGPVKADGLLDEPSWASVPWTNYFQDIEGKVKPLPPLNTRAKLLWDEKNLYVAAELEDPHLWANLRQRDTVIFYDNDFEVFIDPDGDSHAYYELEVNALGTAWDLLLLKPYRDGGPPVNGWDIAGLQVGIHVNGTLNNPKDLDQGWTVELCIPLSALKECAGGAKPPQPGDQWRFGFSRVQWRTVIEDGRYKKEINPVTGKPYPEDNWVWSPQGRINMHMPEMWGYVQFSPIVSGAGRENFVKDVYADAKWALRMVYYAESEYFAKYHTYTPSLVDLGLKRSDFPVDIPIPEINSTRMTFESHIPLSTDESCWIIYQDGRILCLPDSLLRK